MGITNSIPHGHLARGSRKIVYLLLNDTQYQDLGTRSSHGTREVWDTKTWQIQSNRVTEDPCAQRRRYTLSRAAFPSYPRRASPAALVLALLGVTPGRPLVERGDDPKWPPMLG